MASSSTEVAMPMSIAEIAARAQDFEYNPLIRLKVWLRTAELLLREVRPDIIFEHIFYGS